VGDRANGTLGTDARIGGERVTELDSANAPNYETATGPLSEPDETTEPPNDEQEGLGGPKSAATVLVELALADYDLGITADGMSYAVPKTGAEHVVRPLRAGRMGLRAELSMKYFAIREKAAPQQALADALLVLEGMCAGCEPMEAHLRVAEHDGAVYLDMGEVARHGERVIRITADGWEIINSAVPVRFRRTKLTGTMPEPVRDEKWAGLDTLWKLVNVAAEDRPLVLAWQVAALIAPDIPHPILTLFSEQGTGKSSATKVVVMLIDPSPVPLRKPPRDPDGWVTAASGSWGVAIDNLSDITPWLSDSMCRAVTGDGDVRRALYTDGELAVFAFRRCLVVNGIDVGAVRGDFAERAITVTLERIAPENRRTETELAATWKTEYPRILCSLLDLAVSVKKVLPTIKLESAPRMADFAHILAAVDQALGTSGLARYEDQAQALAVESLDSDPFIVALRDKLAAPFTGTAAELLALMTPAADANWRAPKDWPKGPRIVTGILKRHSPALRKAGWLAGKAEGLDPKTRAVRWSLTPAPSREGAKLHSTHSLYSKGQVGEGFPSEREGEYASDPDGGLLDLGLESEQAEDEASDPNGPYPTDLGPVASGIEQPSDTSDEYGPSRGRTGPSPVVSCPECGFPVDGAATGLDLHPDCASKRERRESEQQARPGQPEQLRADNVTPLDMARRADRSRQPRERSRTRAGQPTDKRGAR